MSQNSEDNELQQYQDSFLNYFSSTFHGQISNSVFSQINTYLKDIIANRKLKPPYEKETKPFLEIFSVKAIDQILKSCEKSKSIQKLFQSILSNYTKILSLFITENYPNFIKAAKSIVTQKNNTFFRVQGSFGYGYTETSPFFYENIKDFTKSSLIESITNYYSAIISNQTDAKNSEEEQSSTQDEPYSFNISQSIRILSIINPLSKFFDKQLLTSLLAAVITSYENWILSMKVESLKNFDDDEFNTFNNLLFLLTSNNTELKTRVVIIEISFDIKLFQTFLLRMQFKALQSIHSCLNKTYLQTKEMTKFLKKQNFLNIVIDQNDMHHQLVNDFVAIFAIMIRNRDAGIDEIRKFWVLSTSQHLSVIAYFFKPWTSLFYQFREELYSPFFSMIVDIGQFPEESFKFLQKVAHKTNDESKLLLFNKLREMLRENKFQGIENLVVSLLCLFIPINNEEFCLTLQNECISMISNNESINIALPLFKSSCTRVSSQKAKEYFDAILKSMLKENVNVSDYFDLLLKILKNMNNGISEDEFNDLKELIGPLLNSEHFSEACEFLAKLINLQKESVSNSVNYEFFQLICQSKYFNSNSFNFIKQLFETINTKNIDSLDDNEMNPINLLWELYINNDDCSPFCDYIIGLFELYPRQFVEKCFETISKHENGSLKLLNKYIHFIEDGLNLPELGINQNRFYDQNDYLYINLKGDLDLTLKVIKSISYRSFLQRISRILEKDTQRIRVKKGETYINSNNFHLMNQMTLTISTTTNAYISYVETSQYKNPEIIIEKLPSIILMDDKFSSVLFKLLKKSTNDLALEILNQIQTIPSQLELIQNNPNELSWSKILNLKHPNLFLYRLNIIGNLIQQNNMNWLESFFKSDALISFLKIVLSNEIFQCFSENILTLIFKITTMIMKIDDFQSELNTVISLISSDVIPILMNQMLHYSNLEIDLLFIFKLFVLNNLAYIENNSQFNELLKKMLFSPENSIRKDIGDIVALLPIESQKNILELLLPIASTEKCNEYFVLLKNVASQTNDPLTLLGHLLEILYSKYQLPNKHNEGILQVLNFIPPKQHFSSGLFSVISILLSKLNGIEKETDLLHFISDNILFSCLKYYKPTTDLLNILLIILKRNPDVSEYLLTQLKLLSHYNSEYNRLIALSTDDYKKAWKSHPKHIMTPYKLDLTSTPRARGLINLGATCYMNSTIQQLFNITELREKILKSHFHESIHHHHHHDHYYFNYKDQRDWIEEFQYLFAELSYFPAKALDTLPFVSKWKGWDGETINPREQQDAVEFLQMLLERLEEKEKGLTSMFRGQIVHNLIGRNCDFTTTSTEDFLTLSLEVKNHANIEESFKTFLVPDRFEGQNGYHIEGKGMIDADLYHKIKVAPQILIIQLKRFEYNLSTNARVKVNSEYHFPLELDLSPVMDDNSLLEFGSTTNLATNENNLYELVGVLMHMGSAVAGHYYSHVKREDGEWLTLNDQQVKKCNGESLPMTAAGGAVNNNANIFNNTIENDTNAYLLFYRKKTRRSISFDTSLDKISATISISEISQLDKMDKDVSTSELVKGIIQDSSDKDINQNSSSKNSNANQSSIKSGDDESSSNKNTYESQDFDSAEASETIEDDSIDKTCLCRLVSDIRHIISSAIVTSDIFSSLVMELCSSGQISDGDFLYEHFIHTLRRCLTKSKDQNKNEKNELNSELSFSIGETLMTLFEKDAKFADYVLSKQNDIDEFLISHQIPEIRSFYCRLLLAALSTYNSDIDQTRKDVLKSFVHYMKLKLDTIMNYYSNFNDYFKILQKSIQITTETVHIDDLDSNNWKQSILNFLSTTIPAFSKSHPNSQIYDSIDLSIAFILASQFSIDFSTIESNLINWSLSLHHSYQLIQIISDKIKNNNENTNSFIQFIKNKDKITPSLMSLIFIINLNVDDDLNKLRDDFLIKIIPNQTNIFNFLSKCAARAEDFKGKLGKRFIEWTPFLLKAFLFDSDVNTRISFEKVVYAIFSNSDHDQLLQFLLILIDNKKTFENALLKCSNDRFSPAQSSFNILTWIIKNCPDFKSKLTGYKKDLISLLKKCSSNELDYSYQICFDFIFQFYGSNPSEFFENVSASPSSQNFTKLISSVPSQFLASSENIHKFISFIFPLNCEQDLFYTKSEVFRNACLNGFSDWNSGTDLCFFVDAKIASTLNNPAHNYLNRICSLLWEKQVFERNISYNYPRYIQLSWSILKKYPQSSNIFFENNNFDFLWRKISNDLKHIKYEMFLRPKLKLFANFTNSYISENKGKKVFIKGSKCENLIKKYKKDLNVSVSSVFSACFYTNFPSNQIQPRNNAVESLSPMCNSVSCPSLNENGNDSCEVSKSKSISNLANNGNQNLTNLKDNTSSNSGKGGIFDFLNCMVNIDSDYLNEVNQLIKKEKRPIIAFSQSDSQISAAKFVVLMVTKQIENQDFISASKFIAKELFSLSELKENSFESVDILCQQLKIMFPDIIKESQKNSEIITKIDLAFNNLYRIVNNISMYSFSVKQLSFLLVDTPKVQCERIRWCENAMRIVSIEISKVAKIKVDQESHSFNQSQINQLNESRDSIKTGLEYIVECCKKFNLNTPKFSTSQKQLNDASNNFSIIEMKDVVSSIKYFMEDHKP